jgi:hypothetical protein
MANSSASLLFIQLLIDLMLSSSSEGFIQVKFKGKVRGLLHMFYWVLENDFEGDTASV